MSCNQCHTSFPELTPFGRAFKASGYTMSIEKSVKDAKNGHSVLDLIGTPPLSAMVQASFTHTSQPMETGPNNRRGLNDNFLLPQQLSLFYAGKIAPKVGGFIQVTYDGAADALSIDNTDIRFANTATIGSTDLVYGVSLNNNPTLTDLWNTTPAWGMPFASSNVAPQPMAATEINGAFAQQVLGLNAYAYWNSTVYAEIGAYHSAPVGGSRPLAADNGSGNVAACANATASPPQACISPNGATNVLAGLAPYWRLALSHDFGPHSVEIGTYGMAGSIWPGGTDAAGNVVQLGGPTNNFIDTALDAQYQYIGQNHIASFEGTLIHENSYLNGSAAAGLANAGNHQLNELRASAGYLFERMIGARLSWYQVSGTTDTTLYGAAPEVGSANGNPFSQAIQAEVDYMPWLNTRLAVQYTAYPTFNGSSGNYDGSGRSAGANNTLYLLAWLAF